MALRNHYMYTRASRLHDRYMAFWSNYLEQHDKTNDELKRNESLQLAFKNYNLAQIARRIELRAIIAITRGYINYWGNNDKEFLKTTI